MMTTRLSSDGQIAIPAELLALDRIQPGQTFRIERVGSGEYRLIRESHSRNAGLVDSLLACPEKEYFKPIASESTDTQGSGLRRNSRCWGDQGDRAVHFTQRLIEPIRNC